MVPDEPPKLRRPGTVLFVSHTALPQANAGAARLEGFARYLPSFGWRPVLVTSRFAGSGAVAGCPTERVIEALVVFQQSSGGGESSKVTRRRSRPPQRPGLPRRHSRQPAAPSSGIIDI